MLSAAIGADQPRRFDGYKIIRVEVSSQNELEALEQEVTTLLNCVHGVGLMDALVSPDQFDAVAALRLPTQVVQDDVQAMVERERAASSVAAADPFADFFQAYHPYGSFDKSGTAPSGTILWYMNELVTRYPTLASFVDIGTTIEDRTIWGLRISNDAIVDKPAVLYFGGEHAREWIGTTVPTYFATYLLENYGADPTATDLVDNVEFFLIPVFNVDGYIFSWASTSNRFWRKNRRYNVDGTYGVDLNRNWAEGWGGQGSSGSSTSEVYRGPSAFSEPETQALRDFFLDHPNVRAQLDIHAYGEDVLWPYGYTSVPPADQKTYTQIGQAMRSLIFDVHGIDYDGIGSIFTALYAASGVSLDWTYAELDILSFSFECRDQGFYGFNLPTHQIIPNNEELLPAIVHLTNSDWVRAAPIRFEFPTPIPGAFLAGQDTTINLDLVSVYGSVAPGLLNIHYRYHPDDPFVELPLEALSGNAYQVVLPATHCGAMPEFYFRAETTGGVIVTDPPGAPVEEVHTARMEAGAVPIYWENLSRNPGWTADGMWQWGEPTGQWADIGIDPTEGYTGANVYGYNLSGGYTNNLPEQHLTSPPIDCTGKFDVILRFWRWLCVDWPAYDHASVRVSTNGADWVTVWENADPVVPMVDTAWVQQSIDLSAIADDQPTVLVRWTMGSTDDSWTACGWNIDDIRLDTTSCDSAPGDYDGNGNVDLRDLSQFWLCLGSDPATRPPGCRTFDVNQDDEVDAADWALIRGSWTGPRKPPPAIP